LLTGGHRSKPPFRNFPQKLSEAKKTINGFLSAPCLHRLRVAATAEKRRQAGILLSPGVKTLSPSGEQHQ